MIQVTDEVKQAFHSDSVDKQLRINLNGRIFENDEIYSEEFTLKESIMNNQIQLVGCIASEMSVKVRIGEDALKDSQYAGMPISASVCVELPQIEGQIGRRYSDYIPLFTGYIDKAKKDADKGYLDLTCYDRLAYLGDKLGYNIYKDAFKSGFATDGKMKVEDFRNYMITHLDMDENLVRLPNDDVIIKKRYKSKDIKALDIIKHICQINCCFGRINREGQFDYVFVEPSEASVETFEYYRSLSFDSTYVNLIKNGITIRTNKDDSGVTDVWQESADNYYGNFIAEEGDWEDDSADSYLVAGEDEDVTENTYIISGNMIAYKLSKKKKQIMIANIMRKISRDLIFRKYSVTCNGIPYLEVGDKVKFKTSKVDSEGNPIYREFLVTTRTLKGIQAMKDTYECSPDFKYAVDGDTPSPSTSDISTEGQYVSDLPVTGETPDAIPSDPGTTAGALENKEVMVVVSWDESTGILETTSEIIGVSSGS